MLVPRVITRTARGERGMDIFSSLLAENIICISGPIDDDLANLIIAQILFLEGEDPDKEISLYINSPGGSVTAALAIYDAMQYVMPDISTTCLGQAASTSALLVAAGTRGKRFALPNARLLITQPSLEQISGQATDIEITAREIKKIKQELYNIIASHAGKPVEQVAADCDRDFWMSAEEAKKYGLVDKVIDSRKLAETVQKQA